MRTPSLMAESNQQASWRFAQGSKENGSFGRKKGETEVAEEGSKFSILFHLRAGVESSRGALTQSKAVFLMVLLNAQKTQGSKSGTRGGEERRAGRGKPGKTK